MNKKNKQIPTRSLFLYLILIFFFVGLVSAQQGGGNNVYLPLISSPIPPSDSWPTIAANPQRTSYTPVEVTGFLNVHWYRPIEAYIPQNVQIIAEYGLLYISTSKGLVVLHANNGDLAWRYDTQLPLGHSPTVVGNAVYVGGYDRKLHALNALTGQHLWSFDGAEAGYATNPLVVNGKVYVGNRDGTMYAIGAHGTAQQGQLIWEYETDGPILMSAAYHNNTIYFASNDMYAYALNANTGTLIWQSEKLPGSQYQSYWPVIYSDKVIFPVAHAYREDRAPGTRSITPPGGGIYGQYRQMQLDDVFPEGPQIFDEPAPSQSWAHGFPAVDGRRITEYLEDNPQPGTYKHKPWRRMFAVLNLSNGQEFTFDSDQDGFPEYIPATYWGTGSGNRYPPVVGSDGILYFGNSYDCCSDAKGRVMGWNINFPRYLSFLGPIGAPVGGFASLAEPQAISVGGSYIYRNLCCDRIGDWTNYLSPNSQNGNAWSYSLSAEAPGYDSMWYIAPGAISRHRGWYRGASQSVNAAYHNHGDQAPLIPYQGRLFAHRSNAIIAYGAGNGPGQRPLLTANPGQDTAVTLTNTDIYNRLESEIQKIIDAGHLRPGYYNVAQFTYGGLETYFENPGDTLYTLSIAYPYLSSALQNQVRTYLQTEFNTYFDNEMYARTGWSGAAREAMDLPPEVAADIAAGNYPPSASPGAAFLWQYPHHNIYAMWKYAQNVPGVNVQTVYNLAKQVAENNYPVPTPPNGQNDYFRQQPYELNAWIAGHYGFLGLYNLAGSPPADATLHNQINNELTTLLQLRATIFTKDSYWVPGNQNFNYYKKHLDLARNFMFLTPELGNYLRQNRLAQVQAALDEYEYIAPYWFVSRYETTIGEGVMSNLYNYNSLFHARALILQQSQAELSKVLDVPAFARGDLLYIQNLVTALNAEPALNSGAPDGNIP